MFTYHITRPDISSTIVIRGGVGMDIPEALKIMRALANSVDPETNKKVEEDSICCRSLAVKAINRSISALVSEQKREQRKPSNAFRSWTRTEDAQVCEEVRNGMDFQ